MDMKELHRAAGAGAGGNWRWPRHRYGLCPTHRQFPNGTAAAPSTLFFHLHSQESLPPSAHLSCHAHASTAFPSIRSPPASFCADRYQCAQADTQPPHPHHPSHPETYVLHPSILNHAFRAALRRNASFPHPDHAPTIFHRPTDAFADRRSIHSRRSQANPSLAYRYYVGAPFLRIISIPQHQCCQYCAIEIMRTHRAPLPHSCSYFITSGATEHE